MLAGQEEYRVVAERQGGQRLAVGVRQRVKRIAIETPRDAQQCTIEPRRRRRRVHHSGLVQPHERLSGRRRGTHQHQLTHGLANHV